MHNKVLDSQQNSWCIMELLMHNWNKRKNMKLTCHYKAHKQITTKPQMCKDEGSSKKTTHDIHIISAM